MDWRQIEDHRAFPALRLEDFDREPHYFRDKKWPHWENERFPFHVHSLPTLPPIHNSRYKLLSRTHATLANAYETEVDPERESYNFLEAIGDVILKFYATRAVVRHGCAPVAEDVHVIREKLTNNTTLSYVAQAYRLEHTVRHLSLLQYPPQKMMGDLFEAYVGACWQEAEEDGDTSQIEDWLFSFFDPKIWLDWISLQTQMADAGKEKRLARIGYERERNNKKRAGLDERRAAKDEAKRRKQSHRCH